MPEPDQGMGGLKVASLFSGAGGLDLGLHNVSAALLIRPAFRTWPSLRVAADRTPMVLLAAPSRPRWGPADTSRQPAGLGARRPAMK